MLSVCVHVPPKACMHACTNICTQISLKETEVETNKPWKGFLEFCHSCHQFYVWDVGLFCPLSLQYAPDICY
jgi:hypothetical protein